MRGRGVWVRADPGWPVSGLWWQSRRYQPSSGCPAPGGTSPQAPGPSCPAWARLYSCLSLTWERQRGIIKYSQDKTVNTTFCFHGQNPISVPRGHFDKVSRDKQVSFVYVLMDA